MKKLKLDLAQIQVLSFTAATTIGDGIVNPYGDPSEGGNTLNASNCASCPECLDDIMP